MNFVSCLYGRMSCPLVQVSNVLEKQSPEIFFKEEVRSFVAIDDVVDTIVHFITQHVCRVNCCDGKDNAKEDNFQNNGSSFGRTYNMGGAGAWTRLQFALTAARLLGASPKCLV